MRCNRYTERIGPWAWRRRQLVAVGVLAFAAGAPIAAAQSMTILVGGLVPPVPVAAGQNQLANPGFETGVAPWSGGRGWTLDRHVAHAGAVSYRRDAGALTVSTTVELSAGVYRFSAWVKTQALADGVRLRVDFRPAVQRWLTAEIDGGSAEWRRYEVTDVVVTEPAHVTLKLEADEGTGGVAWFDDVRLEQQLTPPLQTFLLYPNFRGMVFDDGPPTLSFDVQVTLPASDVARHSIRGRVRDETTGRVVAERSFPARAAFVAELDASTLEAGPAYRAGFALVDAATGEQRYAGPTYRVARAPASARIFMRICADRENRVLVHGVPRFVLGADDARLAPDRAADGLRDATAVTLATTVPSERPRWHDGADVVATEPQAMFGPEPTSGYEHGSVAAATALARDGVRNARPIITVLPSAPLSSLGRWPTRAELRNHAYMAIVEGARGLWWSSVGGGGCGFACGGDVPHVADLQRVIDELTALEPVLLADDAPAALAGLSNSNVKTKVKLVNGKGFVLAYNASSSRQSATFTWSSTPGTVSAHAEDRTLVLSGRSFSDGFAPFAAHVYVIADADRGAR